MSDGRRPTPPAMTAPSVVFIQLPQFDNDIGGAVENPHLAARYLIESARRAGLGNAWRYCDLPATIENRDDPALARAILQHRPALLVATLYLWNIERTLDLCRRLRAEQPDLPIAVGGPEVAPDHPFLFRRAPFTAAAVGEGEWIFPRLLQALRGAPWPATRNLWIHRGGRWRPAGRTLPPEPALTDLLPPPSHRVWRPDAQGMAYLETSRGCPLRCAYCRYPHLRRRMSFLPAAEVLRRIRILLRRGTREIRFIDPTFNAHPEFRTLIRALSEFRAPRPPAFFAELKADTLSAADARLLAQAGFREIEVGLQSRNPAVLRQVRRPTRLADLDAGVRRLTRRGIRVTLDIMYGLPGQPAADVYRALKAALRLRGVNVQCLQTLLLPGTEIRARRAEWKLIAEPLPPYGVQSTPALPARAVRDIEAFLARTPRLQSDCPTRRWVGRHLPDLFPEQYRIPVPSPRLDRPYSPRSMRCAVRLAGEDLYANRRRLARWIEECVKAHPHALWQFVLEPRREEPLDLLDELADTLHALPLHLLDRYAGAAAFGRRAARRLMILLPPRLPFARDWIAAAEALLLARFQ